MKMWRNRRNGGSELEIHGWLQDGAPKIAKLVYKWLNNSLW